MEVREFIFFRSSIDCIKIWFLSNIAMVNEKSHLTLTFVLNFRIFKTVFWLEHLIQKSKSYSKHHPQNKQCVPSPVCINLAELLSVTFICSRYLEYALHYFSGSQEKNQLYVVVYFAGLKENDNMIFQNFLQFILFQLLSNNCFFNFLKLFFLI